MLLTGPVPRERANLSCLSDIPHERRRGNEKSVTAATTRPYRRRYGVAERRGSTPVYCSQGQRGATTCQARSVPSLLSSPRARQPPRSAPLTASSASAHGSGDGPAHSPKVLNSTCHRAVRDVHLGPGRLVHRRIRRHRQQDLEGDRHGRHDGAAARGRRHRRHPGGRDLCLHVVQRRPLLHLADDPQQGPAGRRRRPQRLREEGEPRQARHLRRRLRGQELRTGQARCLLHEGLPDPRDLQGAGRLPPVCRRLHRGRGVGRGRCRGQRHPPRRPSRSRVDDRRPAAPARHPDGRAGRRHGGARPASPERSTTSSPSPPTSSAARAGSLGLDPARRPGGPRVSGPADPSTPSTRGSTRPSAWRPASSARPTSPWARTAPSTSPSSSGARSRS